jgi:hypothetical protein
VNGRARGFNAEGVRRAKFGERRSERRKRRMGTESANEVSEWDTEGTERPE